jgi:hypothetical protein
MLISFLERALGKKERKKGNEQTSKRDAREGEGRARNLFSILILIPHTRKDKDKERTPFAFSLLLLIPQALIPKPFKIQSKT